MRKLLALLITEVPHLSSPARRAIAVEELPANHRGDHAS